MRKANNKGSSLTARKDRVSMTRKTMHKKVRGK